MTKLRLAVLGFLLVGLVACSSTEDTGDAQTTAKITEAEYGEEWPFTVSEGTVKCVDISSVVFEADGRTYAVNGTAKSNTDLLDIDPIWADNPTLAGTKKNIGPIIAKGLSLCPE